MILLSGLHKRLLPRRTIDGIRETLGLQTHAAALGIAHAVFADFIGVVGGIKLDAGAIGDHRHDPSAAGIGKVCAGIAENLEIMVVAGLQHQRLEIGRNILPEASADCSIYV